MLAIPYWQLFFSLTIFPPIYSIFIKFKKNGDDHYMSKNRTERLQLRLSPEEKEAIRQKSRTGTYVLGRLSRCFVREQNDN